MNNKHKDLVEVLLDKQQCLEYCEYSVFDDLNGTVKRKLTIMPSEKGAKAGLLAGATIGSLVPGLGTMIGAGLGGAIGFIFGPED